MRKFAAALFALYVSKVSLKIEKCDLICGRSNPFWKVVSLFLKSAVLQSEWFFCPYSHQFLIILHSF